VLPDRWITDTELSPRFPYYTRANADEVGPEPISPLGWTLCWELGCMPGVADGFIEYGVLHRAELALDPPEVFGNIGGYLYNPLSLVRLMGVRMPGATVEGLDYAYFGDHPGVPPYTPHPDDENDALSAKLGESMAWTMTTPSYPAMEAAAAQAEQLRRNRGDLGALSDAELVTYGRSIPPIIHTAWVPYAIVCLAGSLGPGAVQAVCTALGRDADALVLLSGFGTVESADASMSMWALSRTVRESASLMAAFDAGVGGLQARLDSASGEDADRFRTQFADLLAVFGHRGPNEWDLGAPSWDTDTSLPLGMLERLRFQTDDRSPATALQRATAAREAMFADLQEATADQPELQGTLQAGMHSSSVFLPSREQGKNAVIKLFHEAKVAFVELGNRLAARGDLAHPHHVFMALESELDQLVDDPGSLRAVLAERAEVLAEVGRHEPPYIIGRADEVAAMGTWPMRNAGGRRTVATVGDVLQGAAGAPGLATGTARIVLDPWSPGDIGPGDIMVAPTTDPSWTPLFLSVEAVVCNVGAVASHASIVCRELGVPCAVSVPDATSRIPDGATISVDGSTGAVTILALP
jgi:phosphohistidine swiveling domain-containing protein